jgi:zinc transporter ZupT
MLNLGNMKKGIFTGLFTLFFAVLLSAQAPDAVLAAFNQTMPGVNATYAQEGTSWKANFTAGGKQVSFVYSPGGEYKAKETVITKPEVPAPALQDMEARFGSFSFEGVAKYELPDGITHYKYQYNTGNKHVVVYYSANGEMVGRNIFQ